MTCQVNGQTQGLCQNYSFSPANNEITTSGFTYDAAGDLTSDGTYTYQWDAEGRLISVGGWATRSYALNALGQMVEVTNSTDEDPGDLVWDPFGQLSDIYSIDNHWWWDQYQHLSGSLVADTRQHENTVWFTHTNALESVGFMTLSSGGMLQDNTYYPWGQTWQNNYSDWSAYYAGMPFSDAVLGLKFAPAREYNPSFGRWLSPDPLGGDITNPQSLNRYTYALNNPCTLTDPTGLSPCDMTNATNRDVINFINSNLGPVQTLASLLDTNPAFILGEAYLESHNQHGGFLPQETQYNNYFGVQPVQGPGAAGAAPVAYSGPTVPVRQPNGSTRYFYTFPGPGIQSSLFWLNASYGMRIFATLTPLAYGAAVQRIGAYPGYAADVANVINQTVLPRMDCPAVNKTGTPSGGGGHNNAGGGYGGGAAESLYPFGWDPFDSVSGGGGIVTVTQTICGPGQSLVNGRCC